MTTKFEVKFGFPQFSTPTRSKEQWSEAMALNAPRINDKRILSVPTKEAFQSKIADKAIVGYQSIVSLATTRKGVTQDMIYASHRSNVRGSFKKWAQKLDTAFATVDSVVAKRFKDAVAAAANLWADGASARTLRATGTKLEGLGSSVLAGYWLTNHPDAVSSIRHGIDKVVEGSPILVTFDYQINSFLAALTQQLTFSSILALKSDMDATIVAVLNTRLNHLVQSMINPGLGLTPFAPGGLSHIDIVDDPALKQILSVRVDQI